VRLFLLFLFDIRIDPLTFFNNALLYLKPDSF